jgi:hypothetical protein
MIEGKMTVRGIEQSQILIGDRVDKRGQFLEGKIFVLGSVMCV